MLRVYISINLLLPIATSGEHNGEEYIPSFITWKIFIINSAPPELPDKVFIAI